MLKLKKRKDGLCSQYMLHCGYIDEFKTNSVMLTRWHEGGTVYHVRAHDCRNRVRLFWLTFESCEESAKEFKKHRTTIKRSVENALV